MPYCNRDPKGGPNFDNHPYRIPNRNPAKDLQHFPAAPGTCTGYIWVAVKERKLRYYIGETLLFTIYTHYGNFISSSLTATQIFGGLRAPTWGCPKIGGTFFGVPRIRIQVLWGLYRRRWETPIKYFAPKHAIVNPKP